MVKRKGSVTKESDGFRVILERELNHSVETVWNALTDPKKLRIWFTEIEGDFQPGGEIRIFFQDEDRTVTHGRIITMTRPTLFQFSWEDELATWELQELGGNRTRLTLEYSRLADEYAISVPAGWHQLMDQLEEVLNGRTTPYPFGTGPTEEGTVLQQEYRKDVLAKYPELFEKLKDQTPLVIERTFKTTRDAVWEAITESNRMREWYFPLEDFRTEKGFVFEFTAGNETNQWNHRCEVVHVIEKEKLSYTWQYPGFEGISLVTWELSDAGDGTKVTLKHFGLDTFPPDVPELQKKNFLEGWNHIIGNSLMEYLGSVNFK